MISWLGRVAVLIHLVIVLLHGVAHSKLGIGLSTRQKGYAALVIVAAPLVAAVLLWKRHARSGFLLLVLSMTGSLIFGSYFHYLSISADHVSHLPPGDAQGLFQWTALLLVVTESIGLTVGLWGFIPNLIRKLNREKHSARVET